MPTPARTTIRNVVEVILEGEALMDLDRASQVARRYAVIFVPRGGARDLQYRTDGSHVHR
jgi:hypothetical protein